MSFTKGYKHLRAAIKEKGVPFEQRTGLPYAGDTIQRTSEHSVEILEGAFAVRATMSTTILR